MQRNVLSLVGVFLAGLLIGWLALGWWLWPVAYVGEAYTYELNQADRLRYAQGAVDNFTLTGQTDPAWFDQWTPEEVSQALAQVAVQPNRQAAAYSLGVRLGVAVQAKVVQDPTPIPLTVKLAKAQVSEVGLPDWLPYLAFAILGIGLAGGGLWVGYSTVRSKAKFEAGSQTVTPRYTELHTAQFVPTRQASHALAHARLDFGPDKPCDQHFPIESRVEGEPTPGEFGVNQVEDQPAWDVWLFDQRALVTVTKVLADRGSEELASRGEVIGWNDPFTLDTPNLKMAGGVHKTGEKFTVELTVEGKDEDAR